MIIKDLEEMETLVSQNKKLAWDGWDVLQITKTDKGRTHINGKLINNDWYIVKRFAPNRDGWVIPDRLHKP